MKALIAFALLVCLAGCQPAPHKPVTDKYTVQVIEVVADNTLTAWSNLGWAMNPVHLQGDFKKNDLSKYIRRKTWFKNDLLAIVPGESPSPMIEYTDARVVSAAANRILYVPEVKKTEFPPVQLSVGERIINDQTETTELPTDYEIVDDKTVITRKGSFRSGLAIDIELIGTDASSVTYQLKLFSGSILGFDVHTLPNGDEISMPYWESRNTDSEITQPLSSWNMIGGMVTEKMEEGETKQEDQCIFIRILPPSSTVESPTSETGSKDWNFLE
jgi:hypothetical protein